MLWRWYRSLFKPPNAAKRRRWEMLKARGKRNFILRVGVLQFGGAMFVLMTGQQLLKKPTFPRTLVDYAVEIAIGLLIWPLAGYMFGAQMWRFNETYFDELNRPNQG